MADSPAWLAARMRSEGERTTAFFRELSPEQLELTVYSEGSCWKVRQVLAHCVSTETGIRLLVENIRAGGSGSPEDFRLDEYNERRVQKLEGLSAAELLGQFAELREANARLVSEMKVDDLKMQGRHPFLGVAPIDEIMKMLYRHVQIHMREIRKALAEPV
jgi:hypothetical protein